MRFLSDETLHSFIIRQALLSRGQLRQCDLKGIVSYSGCWLNLPKLGKESLHYFKDIPKKTICNYLETKCPSIGIYWISPTTLQLLLDNLFEVDEPNIGSWEVRSCCPFPFKVQYCLECLKDQLYECGVCWFKSSWYKASMCNIHQSSLIDINQTFKGCKCIDVKKKNGQNIYKRLESIISGRCKICKVSFWEDQLDF
jgi:hypothetical protein